MLALADYEADLCSCGGLFSETSAPENEFAYVADGPYRCFRCTAIASKAEEFQSQHGERRFEHALHYSSRKR